MSGAKRFRRDDGLAAVIGILLVLAVLVKAYALALQEDLPIYGEQAENSWDASLRAAFGAVAQGVGASMQSGVATSTTIPRSPPAKTLDVPFVGGAAPLPPDGNLRFEQDCGKTNATHKRAGNLSITDLASIATGCLTFQAEPAYGVPFGYVYEFGGVLYLQSGTAVVVSAPALSLDASSPVSYTVSLTLPKLQGAALAASAGRTDLHVDIVPGASAGEIEQKPNAGNVTWSFETRYPAAWKAWYNERFRDAGFVASRSPAPGVSSADYAVNCVPVDCAVDATGQGKVLVTIEGPRVDVEDIKLGMAFGLVNVGIR